MKKHSQKREGERRPHNLVKPIDESWAREKGASGEQKKKS